MWLLGLGCEAAAAFAFIRRWPVVAPGHLAERFSTIIIIGLDMSLGGMGQQMGGQPVGVKHLLLIGLALLTCTVMWWLYFDLLSRYAEHRIQPASPTADGRSHVRLAHGHYNGLHLVVLAGMVSFGLGLRAIARDLDTSHLGSLGPPLQPLVAVALGIGLVMYILGIGTMWKLLGRKPPLAVYVVAALALLAAPLLIGKPELLALGVLMVLWLILLAAEVVGPRARTERSTLRHSMHAAQSAHEAPEPTVGAPASPAEPGASGQGAVAQELLDRTVQSSFTLLDTDGSGEITWTDFTDLLHRIIKDPSTAQTDLPHRAEQAYQALWTALCESMDVNNDHIITREEYAAYMNNRARDLQGKPGGTDGGAGLRQFLANLDRKHAGAIPLAELIESQLLMLGGQTAVPTRNPAGSGVDEESVHGENHGSPSQ